MKFANITAVVISLFCLVGLAACGGGADSGLSPSISDDVCRTEGSDIVCAVPEKGFSEDCTVLVGTEKTFRPVDYELTDDSIRFAREDINVLDADKVFAQCGDGEKSLIGHLPADAEEADVKNEILPEESAPVVPEEKPEEKDEIIDPTPTTPTTPAEPIDTGTTTPVPSVEEPAGETIKTFTVLPAEAANNFMTFKVTYEFSGAKQAYIYGNIFNRIPLETAYPKCGKSEDGRFLVVQEDGNNLNVGSANFDNYAHLTEGKQCNANNADTSDDCVMTENAYPEGIEQDANFSNQTNPRCRIDLAKNGALITSGTFFTRSFARFGQACLAVQGADDQWSVQCRRVDAPKVSYTLDKMEISKEGAYVDVSLTYEHALEEPKLTVDANKSACAITSHNFIGKNGSGSKRYHCGIRNGDIDLTLKVTGIGEGHYNTIWRHYRVRLGEMKLSFDYDDKSATHGLKRDDDCAFGTGDGTKDCWGTLDFVWKVSRDYTIKDGAGEDVVTGDSHTTFWADHVKLYEGDTLKKTVEIGTSNQGSGKITMKRNHKTTTWKARAYDFTTGTSSYSSHTWGYEASFRTKDAHSFAHGQDDYDHCNTFDECGSENTDDSCDPSGSSNDCGYCVDTVGGWYSMTFDWEAKHIKEIKAVCTTGLGTTSTVISKVHASGAASYDKQIGTIKVTTGQINADNWSSATSCTFTATTYDGQTLQDAHSNSHKRGPWTRNCTYNDDD